MKFTRLPPKSVVTPLAAKRMEVGRIGLMSNFPFFAYFFYSVMSEYPTDAIPTMATDGKRVFFNPKYTEGLSERESIFAVAHEVYHAVSLHPQRMKGYAAKGSCRNLPWSGDLFNVAADYIINADLISSHVGSCHKDWLFDKDIGGDALVEDVYETLMKEAQATGKVTIKTRDGESKKVPVVFEEGPGEDGEGGKGEGGNGESGKGLGKYRDILDPSTDPQTGKDDVLGDNEYRDAVASAASLAKRHGSLPGRLQQMVDDILNPQIDWTKQIRLRISSKVGNRRETWERFDRRRLVLRPRICLPGRRGEGAGTIAVVIDSSGSTFSGNIYARFFAEVDGILMDVRPKQIIFMFCDAEIQKVHYVKTLSEVRGIRASGVDGGGGTDFNPPFEYMAKNDIRPDALVYLTDLEGSFPEKPPAYPVVWCAITEHEVPWGEVVRIKEGDRR